MSLISSMTGELGELLGTQCALEEAGRALSEIIVYLADQAPTGSFLEGEFINGFLAGFCEDSPVELTRRARAACVTG